MVNLYNAAIRHVVAEAGACYYVRGILHPDRILGWHDWVYVLQGGWEILQNGKPYLLAADDLMILQAGQHHTGIVPCEDHTKTYYIHIEPVQGDGVRHGTHATSDLLHMDETRLAVDALSAPSVSGGENQPCVFGMVYHCANRPEIKRLFQEIVVEKWSGNRALRLSALFDLLLTELTEPQATSQPENHSNIAEAALAIIHNNPQTFYTLAELAEQLFVSERTLSRHIRRLVGQPIHQYQLAVKIEMAKRELRFQPGIRLNELAMNLGFCDEFHLSKTFKRLTGQSPQQYRVSLTEGAPQEV